MLVVGVFVYVGCFVTLLFMSAWKVLRRKPQQRMFWRVTAALLWGGLSLAIMSRLFASEMLRTIGASAVFVGLVIALLRSVADVLYSARRLVRSHGLRIGRARRDRSQADSNQVMDKK